MTSQRITSQTIEESRTRIEKEIQDQFSSHDASEQLQYVLAELDKTKDGKDQVRQLLLGFKALQINTLTRSMNTSDCNNLFKMIEIILKSLGIKENQSRLSYLLGDLYLLKSDLSLRNGQSFESSWLAGLSEQVTTKAKTEHSNNQKRAQVTSLARLGNTRLALETIDQISEYGSEIEKSELKKAYLENLQLTGQFREVYHEIHTKKLSGEAFEWMKLLCQLQMTLDFDSFIKEMKSDSLDVARLIEGKLWIYASRHTSLYSLPPKVDTLRKKLTKSDIERQGLRHVILAQRTLEECHETSVSLSVRFNNLGKVYRDRHLFHETRFELVFLAAMIRACKRFSQPHLSRIALGEYEALSLKLSSGSKRDVLGMLTDVSNSQLTAETFQQKNSPKNSKLARTASLAGVAGKGLGIVAKNRVQRLFASSDTKDLLKSEELQKLSQLLAQSFGELKGGMMKVGQVLSLIADTSPQFVNPLRRMHLEAEATPPDLIEEKVERELGKPVRELFASWERTPLAVGSIGQVHKATTHEGEHIVVKVQHDNIEKSLKSDLELVGILKPIVSNILPAANVSKILEEIRSILLLELDYENERRNQEKFIDIFQESPQIIVPKVFQDYSTKCILTTEFIDALSFEQFREKSDQNAKNLAGENIIQSVVQSIWPHHVFNSDPHPNNYLFHQDGRIVLIDFGCVKKWSQDFVDSYANLLLAAISDDAKTIYDAWIATGTYEDRPQLNRKALHKMTKITCAPILNDGDYTFSHDFVRKNAEALYFANNELKKYCTPPAESTMIVRFTWGLYTVLADLNACSNWQKTVLDQIKKSKPSKRTSPVAS